MTTPDRALHIVIDGNRYSTTDDDLEAAALLRRADRDPKTYDLLRIDRHGVEHRIHDNQIVHLEDGEQFVTRRKLHFSIDGEEHTTYDDNQEPADLLRLAGVDPTQYDIARLLRAGGSETLPGDQIVQIADGDRFVTAKHIGGVA